MLQEKFPQRTLHIEFESKLTANWRESTARQIKRRLASKLTRASDWNKSNECVVQRLFYSEKLQNGEKQVVVVVVKDKKDAGNESIRTPCGQLRFMYFEIQISRLSQSAVCTCSSPQNTERGPR
jgi:hypothetical protein